MRRSILVPLLFVAACRTAPMESVDPTSALATITAADVQAHVNFLAADELQGRYARSDEARRAAAYIAARFADWELEPLGDDGGYLQAIEDPEISPNVVAVRRGTGSGYVLVTAHYDHLRPRKKGEDRIFNGADDNASGTAAVLEIAEAVAALPRAPSASFVLVAFTAEELGLRGSHFFAEHAPFPLDEIRGVFNLDMVSRGAPNLIFCEGGPSSPGPLAAVQRANETIGLDVRYDEHPEWLGASDHASFLRRDVPALYFGVEDHEDYHRVTDHADRILPDLTEKVARLAFLAALDLARN